MIKKFEILGIITDKEQLRNSKEGGPRERVHIKLSHTGEEITATTATNSSAGYCLSCSMSYLENKELSLECHFTKSGLIIIDRIISGYYERG